MAPQVSTGNADVGTGTGPGGAEEPARPGLKCLRLDSTTKWSGAGGGSWGRGAELQRPAAAPRRPRVRHKGLVENRLSVKRSGTRRLPGGRAQPYLYLDE